MGRRLRVGVALGGGAARGLAHVGALRALVREGIPIDVVVGTSMGSLIGGAFVATRDITGVERRVREVLASEEFRNTRLSFLKESKRQRGGLLYSVTNLIRRGVVFGTSTLRESFLSAEEFAASMAGVLPEVNVEDLDRPFAAVALDLAAGEEVVLTHGALRRLVSASSAIPAILPPVRLGNRVLVDGGWIDKLPVLPAFRLGADVVIAVDISPELQNHESFDRGLDIMHRAHMIRDTMMVDFSRGVADVVITPDVGSIHWADFEQVDTCIEAGDRAATDAVPAIHALLRRERLRSIFRAPAGKRLAGRCFRADSVRFAVE